MPYETQWVDPEVFLKHSGVKVYHLYKDDDAGQGPLSCWFALDLNASVNGGEHEGVFDVRDLDDYVDERSPENAIRAAIDSGHFDDWDYETNDDESVHAQDRLSREELAAEELALLRYLHAKLGRRLKPMLCRAWENGIYDAAIVSKPEEEAILQQLRNNYGPRWLADLKMSELVEG